MVRTKSAGGGSHRAGGDGWFPPINLQPVDAARAVERPSKIRLYCEDQYDAYGLEQIRLWEAAGTHKADRWRRVAAKCEIEATEAQRLIEAQWERVKTAGAREQELANALSGFLRRGRFEKGRYYLTGGALLCGDVAGVAGAAMYLGEEPSLAICQAVASGVAAVTAGLIGVEAKDSRVARRRATAPDELPAELAKFAHLFRGGDAGETIVKLMALGSLAVASVISISIFALRSSIEGSTAGLVFGGLAAAISLASFVSAFVYTDDIADLLDNARHTSRRESKRHLKLTRNKSLRRHDEAVAAIISIEAEHKLRGEAAELSATAEKNRELAKHPGVAGHGYESDSHLGMTPETGAGRTNEEPKTTQAAGSTTDINKPTMRRSVKRTRPTGDGVASQNGNR